MENKFDERNIIKSAIKVFEVLELLTEHKKLSITRLSELSGYTMSTIQRIVNTLKYLKYIDQDSATYEYFPSFKLYELGTSVVNNISLKSVAKPHMVRLYNEINETLNLGILDGSNIVYLDKIVSKSPLRVELELGVKIPLYCSALGKSIAAFSDDIFTFKNDYIQYTKNTISSDEELQNNLDQVRKLGYAIDDEEYVDGLICLSVPILNLSRKAIASISISIPAIRFDRGKIPFYTKLLKDYANKIQSDLY